MARRRALVLGLDVGDGPLLLRFAREGAMPWLAGFLAQGVHGALATTAELLHVCAWPSLYTGAPPGVHGVYYTFGPRPGVQGAVRFSDGQYGAPPFWSVLDAAGRDVIVLDAPYSHPAPAMRGVQVFEWGTWAHYRRGECLPPARARGVAAALGRYPLGLEAGRVGMRALEPDALAPRLSDAVHAKAGAIRRLAGREPWDVLFSVFGETHAAAHYLWPRDPDAPGAFDPLRSVYGALDAALAEIVRPWDEEVAVLLVSGDGVGANGASWHLLPEVLRSLGFASAPGGGAHGGEQAPRPRSLVSRARDLVPAALRQRVSGWLPTAVSDRLMRRKAAEALDWARTRAFALPTDLEGCVRVNLVGREPQGIVRPGAEYEALCAELAATLGRLRDPDRGTPAVARVLAADQGAPGPRRDWLPDLVVHWAEDAGHEALALERTLARGPSPDPRPGTHRPHGFLAARGRGIAPGGRLFGAHVVDFAPTLLKRCGVDAPAAMAGRAWEELL